MSSPLEKNSSPSAITSPAISTPTLISSETSSLHNSSPYDLVCVGFGPASLAIAVALHETEFEHPPRVLFIEKQKQYQWHSGMMIPGSRMQISFIKDFATLRNPRSYFTFLNYLSENGRLVNFTNLDTFLPLREEYNDYMQWVASFFEDKVAYGEEVLSVEPSKENGDVVEGFTIISKNADGKTETRLAKNVVVAAGGKPFFPPTLPETDSRIIHSAQYMYRVGDVLTDRNAAYKVAVVGAGQSAAEIYKDIHSRFPNSKSQLIFKAAALRPSDDSPFVNEIFDPSRVTPLYNLPAEQRLAAIRADKATNYGVVRLQLIESLYLEQYEQRLWIGQDETQWPHRILDHQEILGSRSEKEGVVVTRRDTRTGEIVEETYDAIVVATGYRRDMYKTILKNSTSLLPKDESGEVVWNVGRNYGLQFKQGALGKGVGIWLQGCCEFTHGLSDSLLSILPVRASEIVENVFGKVPITPGLHIAQNQAPPQRSAKAVDYKPSRPAAVAAAAPKEATTPLKPSASRRKSHSGEKEKKDSCVIC